MRIPISILVFILIVLNSCGKTDTSGCTPASVASEQTAMVNFCTSDSIHYSTHSSGILYEIVNAGTGATPTLTSKIYITYTGKLFNGTIFDSQSDATQTGWVLNSLIDGWKIGLPLIKKGGHIKLVIPSSLAYGCAGAGNTIPPNTPLYFDVNLVDVQ